MTNTSTQDYSAWIGHAVVDRSGDKVGKVSQIYLDDQTGQPEWLAISTGLFKSRSSFVPLQGARADGDQLVIAYDKATVNDAPQVEDDNDGYLQPEEEQALYRYYGQEYPSGQVSSNADQQSNEPTDNAMTRSEEEVRVGTAKQEAGRARLRKYVVTENVQTTVPVSHEEVRVEREPITDANRAAATSGPDISEADHEVLLNEERPVVQKEVVPKERVRLEKDTVTEQQQVNEQVRKEQIEAQGTDQPDSRPR